MAIIQYALNIQRKEQIPGHRNQNFKNDFEQKEKAKRERIGNYVIREQLEVASFIKKIEMEQLRWLGHIEKMNDKRIARKKKSGDQMDAYQSEGHGRDCWMK